MFKRRTNGKDKVYGPNGKGITEPKEYVLMVNSPNEKGMVLWKIVLKK